MQDITHHLKSHFFLSDFSSKKLAAIMSPGTLDKGSIFVKKDRTNEKEYLLLDGICRSYILW